MGTCIICGASVDGEVCASHEEDVAFEFSGTAPSELSAGRYYRGTVDGFADFGVFVNIGDGVTGLLHRSELDKRLESLEWEPGDSVYVQVLSVRDNGNVDLGWSIRQDDRDFRGQLIDTPEGEVLPEDETDAEPETTTSVPDSTDIDRQEESVDTVANGGDTATADEPTPTDAERTKTTVALNRSTADSLGEYVGSVVRVEGEITDIEQTSGPTVFELRDETGSVDCAAFEDAGVRAYPDVEEGDVVRIEGEVEHHYGQLQIETETLEVLEGNERETVRSRHIESLNRQAAPTSDVLLTDIDAIEPVVDEIETAATIIRRAVLESRPIVIRHNTTADGYIAGAAIERAVLPLLEETHSRDDAVYQYFERRPLSGAVYDMDAATNDVTSLLDARERFGDTPPVVVVVDAGGSEDSIPGYDLLDLYGADTVVIDDSRGDSEVVDADSVTVAVTPAIEAASPLADVTSSVLAANVATFVNDDVRDDLRHLPAMSFWKDVPDRFSELAADAGYARSDVHERREAIALQAFYHSYKDKRQLVDDILFGDADDLAAHVSEQFRDKIDRELETAITNLEQYAANGTIISVLDTRAFSNRFDFPSTTLLLESLQRTLEASSNDDQTVIGFGVDEIHIHPTHRVDLRSLAEGIEAEVPDAGIDLVGGRDGYIRYLSGERDAVQEAVVDLVYDEFA